MLLLQFILKTVLRTGSLLATTKCRMFHDHRLTRNNSWTINKDAPGYGEIDIIESFSDHTTNFMTLHTAGACSFNFPTDTQLGSVNNGDTNCQNGVGPGCSVEGPAGSYGDPFNAAGGGVYAMEKQKGAIKIWNFSRGNIPADITNGNPNPSSWGLPAANFNTANGNCDIDAAFPPQNIVSYFSTIGTGAVSLVG